MTTALAHVPAPLPRPMPKPDPIMPVVVDQDGNVLIGIRRPKGNPLGLRIIAHNDDRPYFQRTKGDCELD